MTDNKNFTILGHHLKAVFMLITMAQSPASYLIPSPRYNVSFISHWIHREGILGQMLDVKYNAKHLGLGMRYEAGICTIVISMNGAFQ